MFHKESVFLRLFLHYPILGPPIRGAHVEKALHMVVGFDANPHIYSCKNKRFEIIIPNFGPILIGSMLITLILWKKWTPLNTIKSTEVTLNGPDAKDGQSAPSLSNLRLRPRMAPQEAHALVES